MLYSKKRKLSVSEIKTKFLLVLLILINKIELCKYKEINVEIYYNSNNFKSSKFPFSIKIL
jgi:hypothetical protein